MPGVAIGQPKMLSIQLLVLQEIEVIAKIILEKGSIQLTTNQRKEMVEQKRQMIIQEIHSTAIDPKAKTPHPRTRIELALEESRFSVDPFKRLELQVKDAINILKPLIPLSFEPVRIAFRVSGSAYGQSSKLYDHIWTKRNGATGNTGKVKMLIMEVKEL